MIRTLRITVLTLLARGLTAETPTPDLFRRIPCPSYSEIRLTNGASRRIGRSLNDFAPDAVHIAT